MRRSTFVAFTGLLFSSSSSSFALAEEETSSSTAASVAPVAPSPSESRPGLVNPAAAVPAPMSGWANVTAGTTQARHGVLDLHAAVSPWRRIGIGFDATNRGAMSADARLQFLEESSAGLDLTTSVGWRMLANEATGHAVFGRLTLGRSIGPTYLAVNGAVSQGVGERRDVDVEGGGLFFVRAARILRVGAEGRVRGEAVETYITPDDEGRPVEILAGAMTGVDVQRVLVQALGGWMWPRGPLPPGPAVLAAATLSF